MTRHDLSVHSGDGGGHLSDPHAAADPAAQAGEKPVSAVVSVLCALRLPDRHDGAGHLHLHPEPGERHRGVCGGHRAGPAEQGPDDGGGGGLHHGVCPSEVR